MQEPWLLDHLEQIRRRVVVATLAAVAGAAVAAVHLDDIVDALIRPLTADLNGATLVYTSPADALLFELRVALLAGVVIASPVVLHQAWACIAPALGRREHRRLAAGVLTLSTGLFVAGCLFSHVVVFPMTWRFFAQYSSDILTFRPEVRDTFTLYQRLLLAFGVAFQMPVATLALARLKLLTPRGLLRHGKYAVLAAFAVSAVVTPTPDVVVQTALAAPLLVLYLVSVGVAWAVQPGSRAATDPSADAREHAAAPH